MRDGSVSYPSVLEPICSYCSSVSLCRQCGNVFALKVNLWMHVKRRSRLLKCPGGNMICLFMHVALQRMWKYIGWIHISFGMLFCISDALANCKNGLALSGNLRMHVKTPRGKKLDQPICSQSTSVCLIPHELPKLEAQTPSSVPLLCWNKYLVTAMFRKNDIYRNKNFEIQISRHLVWPKLLPCGIYNLKSSPAKKHVVDKIVTEGEPTVFSWRNLILTPNIGRSAEIFDDFIRMWFVQRW